MLLTAILPDPTGYGRILRDEKGEVLGIIEHKDASEAQRKIDEVNISVYCFETQALLRSLDKLTPNNKNGEYYLTDTIGLIRAEGLDEYTGAIEEAAAHIAAKNAVEAELSAIFEPSVYTYNEADALMRWRQMQQSWLQKLTGSGKLLSSITIACSGSPAWNPAPAPKNCAPAVVPR